MPEGLVGRARFNYLAQWKKTNERAPTKLRTMSYAMIGVKSDIKSPFRLENEAPLDLDLNLNKGLNRLRTEHSDTLPRQVFRLNSRNTPMTGLMCVERAGFESTHLLKDGIHSHLVSYAGSFDVGTCHDIRFISDGISSIIANHFEAEQEIVALRGPKGMSDSDLAQIMEASMNEVQPQINTIFKDDSMPSDDPRFTMGKNSRAAYEMSKRMSRKSIKALNMQPADLLSSDNMQGITAIFDDERSPLIAPGKIHALSEMPIEQALYVIQQNPNSAHFD